MGGLWSDLADHCPGLGYPGPLPGGRGFGWSPNSGEGFIARDEVQAVEEVHRDLYDSLETKGVNHLLDVLQSKPQRFSRELEGILSGVYSKALDLAEEEHRKALASKPGRSYSLKPGEMRSYVLGGRKRWEIPMYYRTYLLQLVGVFTESLLRKAGETLKEGEEAGGTVEDIALMLGSVLDFAYPRLVTIVRTEGTRVVAAARRDLAAEAIKAGMGPQWMIYSAILDDRVTHICTFAHHHKRPADPNSPWWNILPPPNHYNCRSIERYGYLWREEDILIPDWTPGLVALFLQVQHEEFPRWENRPLPLPFVPVKKESGRR